MFELVTKRSKMHGWRFLLILVVYILVVSTTVFSEKGLVWYLDIDILIVYASAYLLVLPAILPTTVPLIAIPFDAFSYCNNYLPTILELFFKRKKH